MLATDKTKLDSIKTETGVRVHTNGTWTANNAGVQTPITFFAARNDTFASGLSASWDGATSLYARVTGWYMITGHLMWPADTTGTYRNLMIKHQGTTIIGVQVTPPSSSTASVSVSALWYMTAGEYVQLVVNHNATTNLTMPHADAYADEFAMVKLA